MAPHEGGRKSVFHCWAGLTSLQCILEHMDAEMLWNDTSCGLDHDLFIKENTRKSCQRIRSPEDANKIQIPQYYCATVNSLHKNERNIAMPFGPAAVYALNADSSPYTKALPAATDLLGSILQRLLQGSRWPHCTEVEEALAHGTYQRASEMFSWNVDRMIDVEASER